MTTDKKDVTAATAYLIGVSKPILENCFDEQCHELLQKLYEDQNATAVRYLCKLRSSLFKKFSKTDTEIRYNLKNLDKLEWFDQDNIHKLEQWGFHIIQANIRAEKYLTDISVLINNCIDRCSSLFPDWLNWNYIKELFIIQNPERPGVMVREFEKYMGNISYYPFSMYINWTPESCGSLLYTDGKFLNIIYRQHGDVFTDNTKFRDAHEETKNNIYDFISCSSKAAIVVDCENSDVYKLYSVLKNLNQDELSKVEKIVLYDDSHTTEGWDWLEKFTRIPVEHVEADRVTGRKSLVDIKMTAGVCTDFYKNDITSFILVSSDSDYWGLISSLTEARFLVMYEYSKCGEAIKKALTEHGIYYCSIDDFCSGNIEELKKAVLFDILEKYLPDIIYLHGRELVKHIYDEARITAGDQEMDVFYKKYIKTLKLKIDNDGNFSIEISKS